MNSQVDRATQLFGGKKILIFGLGLLGGGIGDTRFFSSIGSKVTVTDQKTETQLKNSLDQLKDTSVNFHLGAHQEEDIWNTDFVLRNPSIPSDHPFLQLARKLKKPILMRSSLFAELSGIPIVGITGTRGKTTTTTMIHQLIKTQTNRQVFFCGNINGVSDLELLPQIDPSQNPIAVMELSSWQLQGFAEAKISPHIAVITNLYPDHLNKYPSLEAYYHDKRQIIQHQRANDWAVLNTAQPEFHTWAETIDSHPVWFDSQNLPSSLSLQLPGAHNQANAAAALTVASVLNLDSARSIQILNQFSGVAYRLETIANFNGVEYINDTTSTTPIATITALNSLPTSPIILVGGADKNLPLEDLALSLNQKAKSIILFAGEGSNKLIPLLRPDLISAQVNSMQQAVDQASNLAEPGDIVLLSPGFASFGIFVNEFDRGDQFNQCVRQLE